MIIKSELGYLCRTKETLHDKEGRTKRGLIYWSDLEDSRHRSWDMFFLTAYFQYLMIKIFANDIKKLKCVKRGKNE